MVIFTERSCDCDRRKEGARGVRVASSLSEQETICERFLLVKLMGWWSAIAIKQELINIGQCFVLRRLGRWPRPGHLLRVLRVLRVLQDKKMEDRRFQSMFMILDRLSVLMREEKAAPQHVVVNGQELSRGELVAVLQHRAESCARRSQRTMMQRATQGVQAQPRR
eukprot:gene16672-19808_t